jgi:hypothetical protein
VARELGRRCNATWPLAAGGTVTPVNLATREPGAPIKAGANPVALAITALTPDLARA